MKDVAAAAGVAQSTVSRILNDAPVRIAVSATTRERVHAIASELGYRPHPIARALRGAPTMLLGAVVRDITDPFFAGAIEALSIEAKKRGYSVVLGHARAKADEALALTAVLEARQCDAIVLLGDFRDEPRLVEDLRNAQDARWSRCGTAPSGAVGRFPTVGVDNRAGIRAALEHLTSLGHRRIALRRRPSPRRHARAPGRLPRSTRRAAGDAPPKGYMRRVPNTIRGGEARAGGAAGAAPAADGDPRGHRHCSRSVSSMRPTSSGSPFPTSCPSSASTTSRSPRPPFPV